MTPEFMSSLSLPLEFVKQLSMYNVDKLGIPVFDETDGFIKCLYQFFSSCYLSFFSSSESGQAMSSNNAEENKNTSDKSNDNGDWYIYVVLLIMYLPLIYSILFGNSDEKRRRIKRNDY